jgi:hypothetical protein
VSIIVIRHLPVRRCCPRSVWCIYDIIIGVVSVFSQYNCVYCCDTYLSEGVVHDQGQAAALAHLGDGVEVGHIAAGVADGLYVPGMYVCMYVCI